MGRSSGEHPRRTRQTRPVTIRELARAVGVSETTVSLAFQPHSRIAAATRDKVRAMARKMGYVPNLAARALRLGSPNSIGFLVNDIANPFYAFLVRSADLIARRRGYQLVIADSQWDPQREAEVVENLISSRVRGVIACSSEKSPRTFQALAECKVPCIVVDTVPEDYTGGYVANDLAAAGRLAAEHLCEVRCQRLALLTAGPQMDAFSALAQLRKGFLAAVGQCGLDAKRVCVVPAGLTIDGGKLGFQRLMRRAPDCDGVLCVNDLCAVGAMEAADALGIRVGPDVAIMGIDDLDISSTARISLTSIRQPSRRMIELAVTALLDGIENHESPDVTMLLRPELIVRNSTRRMNVAGAERRSGERRGAEK
jgi:LacI family transcriptional regulator